MANCDVLEGCIFFNDRMQNMPATAESVKEQYCKGNFEQCARYMVKSQLGREQVPANLFPFARSRAEDILRQAG